MRPASFRWFSVGGGRTLALSQLDVRALQLAKAAIRTGIDRALRVGGRGRLGRARTAARGAFGHALDAEEAAAIGLIPRGARGANAIGRATRRSPEPRWSPCRPECLEARAGGGRSGRALDLASDARSSTTCSSALRLGIGVRRDAQAGPRKRTCTQDVRKPRPSGRGFLNPSPDVTPESLGLKRSAWKSSSHDAGRAALPVCRPHPPEAALFVRGREIYRCVRYSLPSDTATIVTKILHQVS